VYTCTHIEREFLMQVARTMKHQTWIKTIAIQLTYAKTVLIPDTQVLKMMESKTAGQLTIKSTTFQITIESLELIT